MPGITLNTTFSNAELPSSLPLGEQIVAEPSLLAWFQADAGHVTLSSNEILTMTDKAGGAGVLTPVSATRRPDLEAGALGSYSAAKFNGVTTADGDSDVCVLSGVAVPSSGAYTYVAIFKPDDVSGGDTVCGRFTDASTRSILNIPNGVNAINFNHGSTSAMSHPIAVDEWSIVIAAFDGTDLHYYGDGVTYTPVTAVGTTGGTSFHVGALNSSGSQALDGYIADLMFFNSNVFDDPELLQVIKDYARLVYGLTT